MAKVVDFLKESYTEMTQKVSWPTWSELQNSAVIVLVASVIIALLVFVMDRSSGFVLEKFYETMT